MLERTPRRESIESPTEEEHEVERERPDEHVEKEHHGITGPRQDPKPLIEPGHTGL